MVNSFSVPLCFGSGWAWGSYYNRRRGDDISFLNSDSNVKQWNSENSEKKRKIFSDMELDQDVNFDWTGETLYPRCVSIILDTDLILHLFVAFRSNNDIGRGPFPYVTNTSWPHHIYLSVFHGGTDTYFKQWAVIVFIHMIRLIVSIINISFRMISHTRKKKPRHRHETWTCSVVNFILCTCHNLWSRALLSVESFYIRELGVYYHSPLVLSPFAQFYLFIMLY